MTIVRQCRFLESAYSSNLTSAILTSDDLTPSIIKKSVLELDHSFILRNARGHASQSFVLGVADTTFWPKFWDNALDQGPEGTKSALAILQTLCRT